MSIFIFIIFFLVLATLRDCSENFDFDFETNYDGLLDNTEMFGLDILRDNGKENYISADCSFCLEAQVRDAILLSPVALNETEEDELDIDTLDCKEESFSSSCQGKSRKEVAVELLQRYRRESGWHGAAIIDWKQIDRTSLSNKYDEIELNSCILQKKEFFQNPEIIDNIHFKPYTADQITSKSYYQKTNGWKKRRSADKRILETFRQETGLLVAKTVSWRDVDKSRLPEKFRNLEINAMSIRRMYLYADSDFITNLHCKRLNGTKNEKKGQIN